MIQLLAAGQQVRRKPQCQPTAERFYYQKENEMGVYVKAGLATGLTVLVAALVVVLVRWAPGVLVFGGAVLWVFWLWVLVFKEDW